MNRPFIPKTLQTNKAVFLILILWLASIACNTIIRTPVEIEPAIGPTPIETPTVKISPQDGMTMILIPSGTFIMGSNEGEENEFPEHEVYLDDFWMDKTEVTNAMYYECIKSGECEAPLSDGFIAPKDHYMDSSRADFPVVFTSWENADNYCQWANRRLPTEAEWEKAARGTDGRIYPWGNQPPNPELLNFNLQFGDLMKVGSFPQGASPYGVLDMAGNALEWVSDWYYDHYYEISPTENPTGPSEGDLRISRGGGFYQNDYEVRVTLRFSLTPWYNQSSDFGFRCATDNQPVNN